MTRQNDIIGRTVQSPSEKQAVIVQGVLITDFYFGYLHVLLYNLGCRNLSFHGYITCSLSCSHMIVPMLFLFYLHYLIRNFLYLATSVVTIYLPYPFFPMDR